MESNVEMWQQDVLNVTIDNWLIIIVCSVWWVPHVPVAARAINSSYIFSQFTPEFEFGRGY